MNWQSMTRSEMQREKLRQTIIFFATSVRNCSESKIFKLLFFLDFGIYRETGRTVTRLQYFAWPAGPVPIDLLEEFNNPRSDMTVAFTSGTLFDEDPFTRREIAMMKYLASTYADTDAESMPNGAPWHQVYVLDAQPKAVIPYELALDSSPGSITKEQADMIAAEDSAAATLCS